MMKRATILILCALALISVGSDAQGQTAQSGISSGLDLGETVEPWRPIHVAGPDRGTTACPVCTYLDKPAVIVFTKDGDNAVELARRRPGRHDRSPPVGVWDGEGRGKTDDVVPVTVSTRLARR